MSITRIAVYTKDIQKLTGKSERSARKIMASIRTKLNKQKHHMVSIGELCQYLNLPLQEAIKHL